ncbi:crossover junction endodeoxyribonuclease RuvC [Candidatus Uhrbacteria bacterium]|nr:crossover junction endodeoxyribonuclease RuvC [Candidatus Uhrbacteria bacterium]
MSDRSPAVILGIDPGIADMGYGVIEVGSGVPDRCLVYGSLKTPAGMDGGKRLLMLGQGLERLLDRWLPSAVGIEKLFFSKNVRTAMQVAEARGVIRACLESRRVPVTEFSPQEVKMAVCGHGSAEKVQVQGMVKRLLKLKAVPKPDDAADALALALALAHTRRFDRR